MGRRFPGVTPVTARIFRRRLPGNTFLPTPGALLSSAMIRMPQAAIGIIGQLSTFQPVKRHWPKVLPGAMEQKRSSRRSTISSEAAMAAHARREVTGLTTIISDCWRCRLNGYRCLKMHHAERSNARHANMSSPKRSSSACTSGDACVEPSDQAVGAGGTGTRRSSTSRAEIASMLFNACSSVSITISAYAV